MLQEKLNDLRPYVTGIRFIKNLPVVDVVLREGWNIFESETITYKPSANNPQYFMVFPKKAEDSVDMVLEHVKHVIEVNIEKEHKLTLLKAKIEELKVLFTNKPLSELERLKFLIENINEPTLEDITTSPSVVKAGVELPTTPHKTIEGKINRPRVVSEKED